MNSNPESPILRRIRRLGKWLRPIGTLVLIGLFARNREFLAGTIDSLRTTDFSWLAFGSCLFAGSFVASAFRVRILLRSLGHSVPHRYLIGDTMRAVGLSASLAVGAGDVYRVGRLTTFGVPLLEAGLVVAIDRAIGTFAIVAMGIVCISASGEALVGSRLGPSAALGGCSIVLAATMLVGRSLLPRSWRARFSILDDPRRSMAVMLTSGLVLASWVGSVVSIARSVGIHLDASILAFCAAWVTVATLLPLSIGGIGVREAGYVVLLSAYGVPSTQAIGLGLLQYIVMIAVSAIAWLPPMRCLVVPTVRGGPDELPR